MKSAAPEEGLGLGTLAGRLRYCRGLHTQKVFATYLGIAEATYKNYERGTRLPDSSVIECLVDIGWNANWLLTGEGAETLDLLREPAGAYDASQEVSGADLMIAVELAEWRLRHFGEWLPKPRFFDLVAEVLQGVRKGLPWAEILGFEPSAREFEQLERSNDGGQGMARKDQADPE